MNLTFHSRMSRRRSQIFYRCLHLPSQHRCILRNGYPFRLQSSSHPTYNHLLQGSSVKFTCSSWNLTCAGHGPSGSFDVPQTDIRSCASCDPQKCAGQDAKRWCFLSRQQVHFGCRRTNKLGALQIKLFKQVQSHRLLTHAVTMSRFTINLMTKNFVTTSKFLPSKAFICSKNSSTSFTLLEVPNRPST